MSILPIKAALVFRTSTVLAVFVRVRFIDVENIGSLFFLIDAWIDSDPWTNTLSVNALYCAQFRGCIWQMAFATLSCTTLWQQKVILLMLMMLRCSWSVSQYVGFSFFLLLFPEGKIGKRKSLPAIGQG